MARKTILAATIIAFAAAGLYANKFDFIEIIPSASACDPADDLCF